MKKRSVAVNAVLNAIKTLSGIIFPLITFPYVSRVLLVENMGVYSYCTSIISYASLLASLGITTYAVREGTAYKNERNKMNQFASEVFSINLISTAFSCLLLIMAIIFFPSLRQNAIILMILSVSIIFTTVGCEWIFNVYEDFGYITIRSILVQVISLVMMFVFVRTRDDLVNYVVVHTVATSGANVFNVISRRKYCRIRFTLNRNMLSRLKPIFVLFANTLATSIYVNLDMTMVGAFSGDYSAGLYSVSTKLYTVVKSLLSAIIIVSIPRLSDYLGEKDIAGYNKTAQGIFEALWLLVTPVVVGLFSISSNIVQIIAGQEFAEAQLSLQILAIALLFCMFGWFFTSCVLIPYKQENKVLRATVIAATINVGMNLVLIPKWQHNAAALTTVIAEFISMWICFRYSRAFYRANISFRDFISVLLGNIMIWLACRVTCTLIDSLFVSTIVSAISSILIYAVVIVGLKNKAAITILEGVKFKMRKMSLKPNR